MAISDRHYSEQDQAAHMQSRINDEKLARTNLSSKWVELWSMYKTLPIKVKDNDGWKSKLNDGRVFELVETVGAYVRNAMFYSDRWIDLQSNDPGVSELLPLVSAMFCDKLNISNFKEEFTLFLVQYLLLGYSSILPYWDSDNDCIAFECLNSYDVFIESSRRYSQRFSYSFRDISLNKAEFEAWIEDGSLDLAEDSWEDYARSDSDRDSNLQEIRSTSQVTDKRAVLLQEYYCPEERTLYRLVDNEIVFSAEVDRCPWLIATLFDTPEDSYPVSLIDSSIGLILANNILHNRRLDNIALSIDNMWLLVDDGVINVDDITTAPGKVLVVNRPDALTPLRPPPNNFNVTYQEGQVLDTKIDRNIGTGNMISANTARQGERVTKAEIDSTKDAGGNRLTDLFERIEHKAILPLLRRAYQVIAENTTKKEVVKLASSRPGVYDFFHVLPKDLSKDYSIKVTGTQSIINRDRNVSLITDFITLVANIPQFQPLIDFKNLYFDLLVRFGFDDPSRYMLKEAPQQPGAPAQPQQPQSPMQQMADQAQQAGGQPMADAFKKTVATGGAVGLANNLTGISPQTSQQMTPEDQQAALQALSTPQQ